MESFVWDVPTKQWIPHTMECGKQYKRSLHLGASATGKTGKKLVPGTTHTNYEVSRYIE